MADKYSIPWHREPGFAQSEGFHSALRLTLEAAQESLTASIDMRTHTDQAFDQLNRRFRPGLMAFFLRRLSNHAEAEDLTQEVFIRLTGVEAERMQSAEAYIFQMAANLLRDRSRRAKVRFDYCAEVMAADGLGIDMRDPMRVAAGRESLADLVAALHELPERTRAIFILYRLENVDKRDIAQTFQISLSSVERDLVRAMAHLTRRVREDA